MYEYAAKLVRVVDGDTAIFDVDLGFKIRTIVSFRLLGINTPELISGDRGLGLLAKAELERLLSLGSTKIVSEKPLKTDKYGRWLGTFYVASPIGEVNVNESLIAGGFAVRV